MHWRYNGCALFIYAYYFQTAVQHCLQFCSLYLIHEFLQLPLYSFEVNWRQCHLQPNIYSCCDTPGLVDYVILFNKKWCTLHDIMPSWICNIATTTKISIQFFRLNKQLTGGPFLRHQCLTHWHTKAILRQMANIFITMTSQWPRQRLKSQASRLFTQSFIRAQIKENIKAPRHWPLCGEFPAQRASNAENASIWWRHHVQTFCKAFSWIKTIFLLKFHWNVLSCVHEDPIDDKSVLIPVMAWRRKGDKPFHEPMSTKMNVNL